MSQRRCLLSLSTIAIVSVAAAGLPTTEPARAANKCLTRPSGEPPEGKHWYYRVDRVADRRCWYLASEAEKEHNRELRRAKQREAEAQYVQIAQPARKVDAPAAPPARKADAPAAPPARKADAAAVPPARPAATGAGPTASESSLQLRWPAVLRYPYSEEPTSLPPSAGVTLADASPGTDSFAPAAVVNDNVAGASQWSAPTRPPERTDPPSSIRAAPDGDGHVFALMMTAVALFGTLGAVFLAVCWSGPRKTDKLKGVAWLRHSRWQPADIETTMRLDLPARAATPARTAAPAVEPFEWSRQFAYAWQQLSEESQMRRARDREAPLTMAERAYRLRESRGREAAHALPRELRGWADRSAIDGGNAGAPNWPPVAASR